MAETTVLKGTPAPAGKTIDPAKMAKARAEAPEVEGQYSYQRQCECANGHISWVTYDTQVYQAYRCPTCGVIMMF
jgi:hypothetical protein